MRLLNWLCTSVSKSGACHTVAWTGFALILAGASLAACGSDTEPATTAASEPEATQTIAPSTPGPTTVPTATATPVPAETQIVDPGSTASPTPPPIASDDALSSSSPRDFVQMIEKVSSAVVFVETVSYNGSGVFVEGGYVVTNAHIIWPFARARLVFPDGSEFLEVPLIGWDLMANIAVLGPIDAPVQELALVDGESLPSDSKIYAVGYPGETGKFPKPSIVQGLLSGVRELDAIGITYLQTPASVIDGHSGGALVSEVGDVIGIIGPGFDESPLGVAASSADLWPRVRQIIAGEDPSGLGDRWVPLSGRRARHKVDLENIWDVRSYVINEPPGTEVDFELVAGYGGGITLYDAFGTRLLRAVDDGYGFKTGSFVIEYDEPYFLRVWPDSENPVDFILRSNRPLAEVEDPDDGRQLRIGRTFLGNFDFPGDFDHYLLHLEFLETIEITARSALADTYLAIYYVGATPGQIVVDDNSGGGLFGLDSTIVYRPPHAGDYIVAVLDAEGFSPGGYVLSVKSASPGADVTSTTWTSD